MRRGTWLYSAVVSGIWWAAAAGSTCLGQEQGQGPPPAHWGRRGIETYVPEATGQPPPAGYITTQGAVHMHLPRHRRPPCQRPASICIKPKIWKFSQAFYQLHHEVWHGVTDPCWLMDPDCCGTSCQQQKSCGLLCLFPWIDWLKTSNDQGHGGVSPCQQCGGPEGLYDTEAPYEGWHGEGVEVPEGEIEQAVPTPADPPVEHPQAAIRPPLRSVLLRRE